MKKLLLLLALPALAFAADPLQIYWIDVEGGAATLIATPEGETILMDAGWPSDDDRDPKRIANVLKYELGTDKLDYFIASHFHVDHVGGVPGLAKLVSIQKFVDHGDSIEIGLNERADKLWEAYAETAGDRRMQVEAGDKLPLQKTDFLFVAANRRFISKPLGKNKPNPLCESAPPVKDRPEDENDYSVGFVVRLGKFEFLDLGDLTWKYEHAAACPKNLFGEVDLYQVTHHGMDMSGAPEHVHALKPQVAVMNNGHRKGGRPETYETLMASPGLEDLWQVHAALVPEGAPNTDEEKIANLAAAGEGDKGHWIKAEVQKDGTFTVTNSRNGFSKTYKAR